MHPADVQDREVSKVFADGGIRGSTRRDRLKERTLPDIPEIVERTFARSVPWPGYSAPPAAS